MAGGFIGGAIALIGVTITQRHSDKQDERKRMEDARKLYREERKKAYVQFTACMNKFYLALKTSTPDLAIGNLEKMISLFAQYQSEILLINLQIAKEIAVILAPLQGVESDNLVKVFDEVFAQYYGRILPLMLADLALLSSPEDPSTKHWWQRWK